MNLNYPTAISGLCLIFSANVFASNFYEPHNGDKLLGIPEQTYHVTSKKGQDLIDIAVQEGIGQNEIVRINPKIDRWLIKAGRKIRISNSYLLPDTKTNGVVLNLPEYRMYYYPTIENGWEGQIATYPISIGRLDWNTPLGTTKIIQKIVDPTWTPPISIKREHAAKGDILPDVVPAGPDNPLGLFAMRLGVPGYLIHGTNKPLGLGMRVSHGCIRMHPDDIELLFPFVENGTPVHIVNQPIKVGWSGDKLYIEVHPDLEGKQRNYQTRLDIALNLIAKENNNQQLSFDSAVLKTALDQSNGIPVKIYQGAKSEALIPEPEIDPIVDALSADPIAEPLDAAAIIKEMDEAINKPTEATTKPKKEILIVDPPVAAMPVVPKKSTPKAEIKPPKKIVEPEKIIQPKTKPEREFKNSPFAY